MSNSSMLLRMLKTQKAWPDSEVIASIVKSLKWKTNLSVG